MAKKTVLGLGLELVLPKATVKAQGFLWEIRWVLWFLEMDPLWEPMKGLDWVLETPLVSQ